MVSIIHHDRYLESLTTIKNSYSGAEVSFRCLKRGYIAELGTVERPLKAF